MIRIGPVASDVGEHGVPLRFVIGIVLVSSNEATGIGLPASPDGYSAMNPLVNKRENGNVLSLELYK